jgi:hypothetical protein
MSQPEPSHSAPQRPRWPAVSIALVVLGLLIFVPASLCTVAVLTEESSDANMMVLVLAFGGVPAAAGAALIYAGYAIGPGSADSKSQTPPGEMRPRWTGASIALFVLGLLIFLPSALCTLILGGYSVFEAFRTADLSGLFAMLMMGGVPAAIGAALVYAGLKIRRRN